MDKGNWRLAGILGLMLAIGTTGLVSYVVNLQDRVVSTTALESIRLYSDTLSEFRTIYTADVVNRVGSHPDISVTHDYQNHDFAIPLPVTFSEVLGEQIGKHLSGAKTHFYSAYPFPWRKDEGGLNDDFRRRAWLALNDSPNSEFFQFTTYKGQPVLRYAKADLMRESCVDCHNQHPDTPKTGWKVGDVRGVLEVIYPTENLIAQKQSGLDGLYVWTITVALFGAVCLLIMIIQFRCNTKKLERRVEERTTKVKTAEMSLRETMEFNNRLLETVRSIIIGVDTSDNINYWNKVAEDFFTLPKGDVLGQQILNVDLNWDWGKICRHVLECMTVQGHNERFEIEYVNKSGRTYTLLISITAILSDVESHKGYLIVADDITEQKNQQFKKQQTEKLQSIGQLAAGVAHEINTPIQYLSDNIRFLQESFGDLNETIHRWREMVEQLKGVDLFKHSFEKIGEQNDLDYILADVPKALEQSEEGVGRVSKIVRAMKDFSHPGTKNKEPTDINRMLESTITVSKNEWKYVAEVDTQLDPLLGKVACYSGPIHEVLLNIIINAAQAIELMGDSNHKGKIKISTKRITGFVEICIEDTGPGIPKNIQTKVFDPFFTTKEVGKGTGQGLSLSHKIVVQQHNGELFFESIEGVGTTFTIRLPIEYQKCA